MMQALTVEQLQQALIQASQVIIANEPLLTQIDSIIGDGDHGTGMRDGFSVLQETLKTTKYPDIFALMRDAGIALVKTMGGASGVIFGTMFIAGHEGVRDRTQMDARELVEFFRAGAASIAKRGRTSPGIRPCWMPCCPLWTPWSKPAARPKTWSRCWRLLIRGPWMG